MSKMKRNITDLNIHLNKKVTACADNCGAEQTLVANQDSTSAAISSKLSASDQSLTAYDESTLAASSSNLSATGPEIIDSEALGREGLSEVEVVDEPKPDLESEKRQLLKMSFSTEMLCKSENLAVEEIEVY